MKKAVTIFCCVALALLILPQLVVAQSYGAIAYSQSTGNWGSSYNFGSSESAIREAEQRCGQPDCVWKVWFQNSCGALAKASNGALGWSYCYDSLECAKARALAECEKRGDDCNILCWSCTDR